MLLGDLLTTVQENLPIKIAVYDNGKLGFVDIEQKAAGLVPVFTDLKNPNFGDMAKAAGLWGRVVSTAGELDEAVKEWLAQPGPALLHVKVKPMQLVSPPSPFVSRRRSSAWPCIARRRCCKAKATMCGRWSSTISERCLQRLMQKSRCIENRFAELHSIE